MSTYPTLRAVELTKREKSVIVKAINSFSRGGGHPMPTVRSIGGFTQQFALKCLKQAQKFLSGVENASPTYVLDLEDVESAIEKLVAAKKASAR